MSSGFEIHQDKALGFGEKGLGSSSCEPYIKLTEAGMAMLAELRGARLSFFLCICFREIAFMSRKEPPYAIDDIHQSTRYSVRALKDAAAWLVAHDFVRVHGTTLHGEKLYRPNGAYAYFGHRGDPPPDDSYAKIAQQDQDNSCAKKGRGYAKTDKQVCKNQQKAVQKSDTTDRRRLSSDHSDEDTPSSPEALGILIEAGLFTADRDFATNGITIEQAVAIAHWMKRPTGYKKPIKDPASWARKCLLNDPKWLTHQSQPERELDLVGAENARRSDINDFEWHRMSRTNRRHIIAKETGRDLDSIPDDPHFGCTHVEENAKA